MAFINKATYACTISLCISLMHLVQSEMRRILFMLCMATTFSLQSFIGITSSPDVWPSLPLWLLCALHEGTQSHTNGSDKFRYSSVSQTVVQTQVDEASGHMSQHSVYYANPNWQHCRLSDQDSGHVMHRKLALVTRLFTHLQLLNSMAHETDILRVMSAALWTTHAHMTGR